MARRRSANSVYTRKDRKPSVGVRGIRVQWSDLHRCWQFRAVRDIGGKRRAGRWRRSPEAAIADLEDLAHVAHMVPLTRKIPTLEIACELVAAERIRNGVSEPDVEKSTRAHARFLYDVLGPDTRMTDIDEEEVVRLVGVAKAEGRSPNTLLEKDLPLLSRAFRVADIDDPVPGARERLSGNLKRVPPKMDFYTDAELASIVQRMRTATFKLRDGTPVPVPARDRDADIVELMAYTGVRSGELCRIKVGQIDERRRSIPVVSKDRSHPRDLELEGDLLDVALRLAAAAREAMPNTPDRDLPLIPGGQSVLTNMFRRWQGRLDEPKLNGRTLRHAFTSGVLATGGSATDAMNLAGHRRMSTTDRYSHAITDRRKEVAGRWIEHVRSLASKTAENAETDGCREEPSGSGDREPSDPPE